MKHFDQLDEASTFLASIIDEELSDKEACGIKKDEALRMMQALHALFDNEVKKLKDLSLNISIESCRKSCHCGSYSDLYSDEKIKQKFLNEFVKTTKEEKMACVMRSAKWLCSSDLIKNLRNDSPAIPSGL